MEISDTYKITKVGNNIKLETNSEDYPSGEYERMYDYTMSEYYQDNFNANESYLADPKYNSISEMTNSDGEKIFMYMFKTRENKVHISFVWEDGYSGGNNIMEIDSDGSLVAKDLFDDHVEERITFNSDNTQFTLTEYNEDGTINNESSFSGTYTYKEAITMEKIVNNLDY